MQKSRLERFFNDDYVTPIRQGTHIEDTRRLKMRAELRAKRPPVFVYDKGRWVHENKVEDNIFLWRKQGERDRLNELAEKQAEIRELMMHAQKKRNPKAKGTQKETSNKGTKKLNQNPPRNPLKNHQHPQRDLVRNIMKNLPKTRGRERISNTYSLLYKMAPSRAHRLAVIEEVKTKLNDNRLSTMNKRNLRQLVSQENAKGHLGLLNRLKQDSSLYKDGRWVKKTNKQSNKKK